MNRNREHGSARNDYDRERAKGGGGNDEHPRERSQQGTGRGHRQQAQQGVAGQGHRQQTQQAGAMHGSSRQQSQLGVSQGSFGGGRLHTMAEVALRGTALLWDLQMETARNLWRTQARTAAMLGIPDYSDLFKFGDERTRRLFTTSAEQVLNSARQARDTMVEMQRQIGRLAEQQTMARSSR
jgi:hypothetical protein